MALKWLRPESAGKDFEWKVGLAGSECIVSRDKGSKESGRPERGEESSVVVWLQLYSGSLLRKALRDCGEMR
jgi:hypothetical protein